MILYNETVGVDLAIEREWLAWMKATYIPQVMKTGMFVEFKIYKVLTSEDEGTVSYSVQYFAKSMDQVEKYLEVFAPVLIEELREKFKDHHAAFRTLLEEM
jgi:hypothetical protein